MAKECCRARYIEVDLVGQLPLLRTCRHHPRFTARITISQAWPTDHVSAPSTRKTVRSWQ